MEEAAVTSDLKAVMGLENGHGGTGVGMAHGAKHHNTAVDIIYICPQGIAHGDAVTGAAGGGEDMDMLFPGLLSEERLKFFHKLPVPGKGTGCHHHCLAADFYSAAAVLGQNAAHGPVLIGKQFFCRCLQTQFAAIVQEFLLQEQSHLGANLAGSDHAVDALAHILPWAAFFEHHDLGAGTHMAGDHIKHTFRIVGIQKPVRKVLVGCKHAAEQLGIHVAVHPFHELLIAGLAVVFKAEVSAFFAPMNPESTGIPGTSAHFVHFFQKHHAAAAVLRPSCRYKTRSACADDAYIALPDNWLMGSGRCLRLLRVCDASIVADPNTFSAGNALLRVDPVFCVLKPDGTLRALHPATMAGRAKRLINYICHRYIFRHITKKRAVGQTPLTLRFEHIITFNKGKDIFR